MKIDGGEARVVGMWTDLVSREDILVADTGEPLRVIYPGRPADDRGADFCDAVIMTAGGIKSGAIEIHVNSADWARHGHHRDPVYNNVILHVFLEEGRYPGARLANGETVPSITLKNTAAGFNSTGFTLPCARIAVCYPEGVLQCLEEMGRLRFQEKVSAFGADIVRMGPGQALYRGIAGALGYHKNTQVFQNIAEVITLERLEEIGGREITDGMCRLYRQSLLLGTAGFLPSQRKTYHTGMLGDGYVSFLEQVWRSFDSKYVLPPESWNLFKVRPANLPVRRLVALADIITRYRRKGLLSSVLDIMQDSGSDDMNALVDAFVCGADGCWLRCYDFGRPSSTVIPALLGRERASLIVVNVLLPFIAAFCPGELAEKALAVYSRFPVQKGNAVEKHMLKQLGIKGAMLKTACRQQGLLHVYKTLCTRGRCPECRFNPANGSLNFSIPLPV